MYVFCTLTLGRQRRRWLLRLPTHNIIIIHIVLYALIHLLYSSIFYKNPNAPPPSPRRPRTTTPLIVVVTVTVAAAVVVGKPFLWRRRRAPLSREAEARGGGGGGGIVVVVVHPTTRVGRSVCSPAFVRRLHRRCHWLCWSLNEVCIDTRARALVRIQVRLLLSSRLYYNIFLFKTKNYNN